MFPGSCVPRYYTKSGGDFLKSIFSGLSGIPLSQLKEITGVDASALKNWVKRGWVAKPVGKRYNIDQTARMLIINMLRDIMQLQSIAFLLRYINGDTEDISDDIIPESELYGYLCDIIDSRGSFSGLDDCIEYNIRGYEERIPEGKKRLVNAIKIIILAYEASILKSECENALSELGKESV